MRARTLSWPVLTGRDPMLPWNAGMAMIVGHRRQSWERLREEPAIRRSIGPGSGRPNAVHLLPLDASALVR